MNSMAKLKSCNIFAALPAAKKRETFQVLQQGKGFRVERIVSRGQSTPEGQWLCSKAFEWVIVLSGRAHLLVKGARESLDLKAGDYVFIPAFTRHRVDWTHPRQRTVWLAVHGPVRRRS